MSRAKTLVTGATGMTGSHTVQLLLKRGHTVRVIAHNEDERSMRLQELVFYGNARVTEGGAVDLLQRLARIYLGPNADYPPAAMRNIPRLGGFNLRRFLHEY